MITLSRMLIWFWLVISGSAGFAESYPVRPIKLIVPYPAGGGTDIAARWIGQKLSEVLHQQIIVDNRAGANGNLGTNVIAKSAPDGYLIGMATPGPVTVGRSLYPDLPYDPQKDLIPLVLANESPIVLVANPSVPAKSLMSLLKTSPTSHRNRASSICSRFICPRPGKECLRNAVAPEPGKAIARKTPSLGRELSQIHPCHSSKERT
jgi:tripartite-type tricarboxylate transporter receptor subunit TctC